MADVSVIPVAGDPWNGGAVPVAALGATPDPDPAPYSGDTGSTMLDKSVNHLVQGAGQGLLSAATLPRDVMQGSVDPMSDEGMARTQGLVGLMAGTGMPMAEEGAAGIFGGRLSKTADLAKADQAESMLKAGADPSNVWSQTGWFQGADGKMRYEIPDDASKFNASSLVPQVGQMMSHPSLMSAYPDLAGVKFSTDVPTEAYGAHYPADVSAGLAEEIALNGSMPIANGRDVMLHELQHAVQSREGFAGGADPATFSGMTPDQAEDAYNRSPGEVEARNVQARKDLTPTQRATIAPWVSPSMFDMLLKSGGAT